MASWPDWSTMSRPLKRSTYGHKTRKKLTEQLVNKNNNPLYLEAGDELVLDFNGGAESVVSGPLLGHGHAVVGALVLGLQAASNLYRYISIVTIYVTW